MKVLLVLAALCAIAVAQQPSVQQSLALFDQNGGILTVYGTGFIQRNINQFTYRLFAGAGPCTGGCRFFCHYRTMTINAAGTITQCEVPYIADGTLGVTGSNYITLEVNNANGASGPPVTVATIRAVPTTIASSTSNPIPQRTTGITIAGAGFPSQDSLFQFDTGAVGVPAYALLLSDGTNTFNIDLIAARGSPQPVGSPTAQLVSSPMTFWDRTAGATRPAANRQFCRWGRTQIDCWYLAQGTPWILNNNVNGLFATLTISQSFSGAIGAANTDVVGPVQIGVITANVAPITSAVPVVAPFNPASFITATDPFITISATNLLQFPVQNSNIFVPAQNGANQDLRCDTVSVTATTLTCQLTTRPTAYRTNINANLAANPITGFVSSGALPATAPANVPVALVNSVSNAATANVAFRYPLNPATLLPDPAQTPVIGAITPDDQPIQQDARSLTIRSAAGAFSVLDLPQLFQYALSTTASGVPLNVLARVTLNGLFTAGPITCQPIFPDQVEPNSVALPNTFAAHAALMGAQSVAANDVCTIISMSPTQIVLRLPGAISAPVGTVVTAEIGPVPTNHLAVDSRGPGAGNLLLPLFSATPVGIVAPGAGVGGDPHFFGFLGEKYEFAGEAGRVYNLLSDEGIQLNAEIGYWHWNRGKETIIRKLALKTDNHRVLIDAGGNHLGTEGFSISVDGASIAPSRIRQTYLGSDGWLRWYPLTADDKFRLPLWERHQGVALIEIVLNDYKFEVLAVEEGKDKEGVWHKQPSRFLDFMAGMLTERRPHGLFGQSAHLRANQRSVADFAIEGQDADYEVSGLFGDDFAFNKFTAKK